MAGHDRSPRRRAASFWIVAGALASLLLSANIAATLYAIYSRELGFSRAVLALIFATYTLVLVPALLACGQLSDRFGRRPIILAALGRAQCNDPDEKTMQEHHVPVIRFDARARLGLKRIRDERADRSEQQ